jgi:hypothetical protein
MLPIPDQHKKLSAQKKSHRSQSNRTAEQTSLNSARLHELLLDKKMLLKFRLDNGDLDVECYEKLSVAQKKDAEKGTPGKFSDDEDS